MNNNTNTVLKYAIFIGLAVIAFTPLYIENNFFFPFITGKAFMFRIAVEIIFALWLVLILRERGTTISGTEKSVAPKINTITICVTAFTVITLIADLFGLNPLRSIWSNFERMEGWLMIIHLWAYFMVLSSVMGYGEYARKNWHRFLNVILFVAIIVGIYGFVQYLGYAVIHQGSTRIDASLGNSAYMAVYMLINAFIALYMAVSVYSKNILSRYLATLYSFLFIFYSFNMFQTSTRGTMLGWFSAILLFCAIYSVFGRKNNGQSNYSRILSLSVIILFIIAGFAFYKNKDASFIQNNDVLKRLASISLKDTKTQARGYIWPMAIEGITDNPKTFIIGIGQENFNYLFNKNYNPEMWRHEQWFDRAHNVFLDWFVASGILGFIAYLSLYVISIMYIAKSKSINLTQKSLLISLISGYAVHNIFVFDNQTSYIMFFTLLAFVHSLRQGKIPKIFLYSDKKVSEDYLVIRDYVFVPVIVIISIITLYSINIRVIKANNALVKNLVLCQNGSLTTKDLNELMKINQTVSGQEAREHMISCTANTIARTSDFKKKNEFYTIGNKIIEKQISVSPEDARIYVIAGGFYNSVGDYSRGLPLLLKAAELSPKKQTILFELAENYINSGNKVEALKTAEYTYNLAKDNDTSILVYISNLIANDQEAKAREIFKDTPEVFLDPRVADIYIAKKQFNKAIDLYKKLMQNNPNDRNLYSALANIYVMSGQNYMAIQTLNDASKKFPEVKVQADSIIKQIQEGKFNR